MYKIIQFYRITLKYIYEAKKSILPINYFSIIEVIEVIERLESYRPSGLSWTPSAASALLALYRL